jgi:hypothetical protein
MRYWFLILAFALSGCALTGNTRRDYGTVYPEGQTLTTSCVFIRSFDQALRSSPKLYGEDSFVGYIDHGPGMPRGPVFLVLPLKSLPTNPGELLMQADPKHREFWLETKLTNGQIALGQTFEAIVPPLQHSPDPNSTIVEREEIRLRGQIHAACGKQYLVAAQSTPMIYGDANEWTRLRRNYDQFVSNLRWP